MNAIRWSPLPESRPTVNGLRERGVSDVTESKAARIGFLDRLRGVAIVLVIAIHAFTSVGLSPTGELTERIVWVLIAATPVPIFFLVDGWLYARSAAQPGFSYHRYVRNSVRRLLLPWFVFTLLYGLLRFPMERRGLLPPLLTTSTGVIDLLRIGFMSRVAIQLYFLPALFLVRLITPLLRPLIFIPAWLTLMLSIGYLALFRQWFGNTNFVVMGGPGDDPVFTMLWRLPFFMLGIACYRERDRITRFGFPLALVGASLSAGLLAIPAPSVHWVNVPMVLALVGWFAATDRESNGIGWTFDPWKWLGFRTMGIFLLHLPIPLKIARMMVARVTESPWLALCLATVTTLLLTMVIAELWRTTAAGRWTLGEEPETRGSRFG